MKRIRILNFRLKYTQAKDVFCLALCALLVMLCLPVEAQQKRKISRLGVLEPGPPPTKGVSPSACNNGFRQGLREIGYLEGENILVEYRFAAGLHHRVPDLFDELVRLKPDLLWTHSTAAAVAAKQATSTIPTVIGVATALVEEGVVVSLARPGGNITGMELRDVEVMGKRIELLKRTLPNASRVALLLDPANPFHARLPGNIEAEARTFKIKFHRIEASGSEDFDRAFAAIIPGSTDALMVPDSPMFARNRHRIFELAINKRLPTISGGPHFAEGGSLLSYGVDPADTCRRSATLVDKILKGSKPAELPVERPTKFNLVVNLKTAKAIRIAIPAEVLATADKVIR